MKNKKVFILAFIFIFLITLVFSAVLEPIRLVVHGNRTEGNFPFENSTGYTIGPNIFFNSSYSFVELINLTANYPFGSVAQLSGGRTTQLKYNASGIVINLDGEVSPNEQNLTLSLHFNNQSAYSENQSFFYDFSGNDNNGTCNLTLGRCPVLNESGKIRGAYLFDGINDTIEVASSQKLNVSNANFTFSMWVNPKETAVDIYVGKRASISPATYLLIAQQSPSFKIWISYDGCAAWDENAKAFGAIDLNAWSHLVLTRVGNNISAYKNGVMGWSASTSSGICMDDSPLRFGGDSNGNYLNGSVDEFAFWNGRGMNVTEVNELFLSQNESRRVGNYTSPSIDSQSNDIVWINLTYTEANAAVFNYSFNDSTQASFNLGTFNQTTTNASGVIIAGTNTSGNFTSQTIDTGSAGVNVTKMEWTDYGIGHINDSNVVFLARFDNSLKDEVSGNLPFYNRSLNFTLGRFDSGVKFDQTADLKYNISNYPNENGTVEFWLDARNWYDSNTGLFNCTARAHWMFHMSVGGNDTIFRCAVSGGIPIIFYEMTGVSYSQMNINPNTAGFVNGWNHIAFTWNGTPGQTTGTKRIFVNGVQRGVDYTGRMMMVSPKNFTIGNYHLAQQSANAINTTIDDFMIYNRAKTAAEIQQDYNQRIDYYLRNSSDGSAFGPWQQIQTSGDSLPANLSSRYIQYKVNLFGNQSITPIVYNVNLSYALETIPTKIYTRTSADNSTWAAWSELNLTTFNITSAPNRYLQYQLRMETEDGNQSAIVSNINLTSTATDEIYLPVLQPSNNITSWIDFNATENSSNENPRAASIDYYISTDNLIWVPVNRNANISSNSTTSQKLYIKARLTANQTGATLIGPTLGNIQVTFDEQFNPNATNIFTNATSSLNHTNDNVTVYFTYTDDDGDSMQYNETMWFNSTGSSLTQALEFRNYTTLYAQNTTKNQTWIASVRVHDGTNWSIWQNSTNITIANSIPLITLNLPANNFHTNINNTIFNFTLSDIDSDVNNCTLYLNVSGPFISRGSILTSPGQINITNSPQLSDGNYEWYVNCSDGELSNTSMRRNITIDTINPIITYFDEPAADNSTMINRNLSLGISCSDANLFRGNLTIVGNTSGVIYANYSGDIIVSVYNFTGTINTSSYPDQNYTVETSCTDDHTYGSIKKLNKKNSTSNNDLIFGDDNSDLKINAFIQMNNNNTLSLPGDFNFKVTNDSSKYKFSMNFTVQGGSSHHIRLLMESPDLIYRGQKTGIDGHFVFAGKYYVDFSDAKLSGFNIKTTVINSTAAYVDIDKGGWSNNEYVNIDPVVGGLNTVTENVTFSTDFTKPIINFTAPTPANDSTLSVNYFTVNVSVTDINFLNFTIYLYLSNGTLLNSSFSSLNINNVTFSDLTDGSIYYFIAEANDKALNSNQTGARFVTVSIPVVSSATGASGGLNFQSECEMKYNGTLVLKDGVIVCQYGEGNETIEIQRTEEIQEDVIEENLFYKIGQTIWPLRPVSGLMLFIAAAITLYVFAINGPSMVAKRKKEKNEKE